MNKTSLHARAIKSHLHQSNSSPNSPHTNLKHAHIMCAIHSRQNRELVLADLVSVKHLDQGERQPGPIILVHPDPVRLHSTRRTERVRSGVESIVASTDRLIQILNDLDLGGIIIGVNDINTGLASRPAHLIWQQF